ncbi:hypothetical protein HWV62_19569 [Athelia sp. TMB]|nr:hypothetical protein HWV62_19569 [Athelia sp. TMB]
MSSEMIFVPRKSNERGNVDHGWMKTFHTFSFASYQRSGHESFGSLRALNENRIAPPTGFGTHSHPDYEVFSYIVSGELQISNQSSATTKVLKRGDVQLTSAGTGIYHSEKTHGDQEVHLLQIWSSQSPSTLVPSHFIRHFTDEDKKKAWVCIAAPATTPETPPEQDGEGPVPIRSAMHVYTTLLTPAVSRTHTFQPSAIKGYIHVVQTSGYNAGAGNGAEVKVTGENAETVLREGDGAYMMLIAGKEVKVENVGAGVAEVLLFEME